MTAQFERWLSLDTQDGTFGDSQRHGPEFPEIAQTRLES